ncbi:MAG: glycine cleavage system protein R [Solirubrobacterales bacterium]
MTRHEFAITAIGRDRPGIVAAVSRALLELEGNIEDSQMSILRGHFAVMLIVGVPAAVGADQVARRLGGVRDELGLEAIMVEEVDELDPAPPRPTHVLTVYGADHPGIVSAVAGTLAAEGVNITDLETRLAGSDERPLYAMLLELALGDADPDHLLERLRDVGEQETVEVSLRELDAEAL